MAQYDHFAEQYHKVVEAGGLENSYRYISGQLMDWADSLKGKNICDVGCGQGELSCRLSLHGGNVTGIDLSEELLGIARQKTDQVTWIQDDAAQMKKMPNETFDCVVSNMMLMDTPNHKDVFESSWRILKPGGLMVWVITHPCFQSPFSSAYGDGSRKIVDYEAQFWKSAGSGTIRSTLGAYHRPIAQYINDFILSGFSILRIDEIDRTDTSVDALPMFFAAVGKKESS